MRHGLHVCTQITFHVSRFCVLRSLAEKRRSLENPWYRMRVRPPNLDIEISFIFFFH